MHAWTNNNNTTSNMEGGELELSYWLYFNYQHMHHNILQSHIIVVGVLLEYYSVL